MVGRAIPSRSTDPTTSHEAFVNIRIKSGNQRTQLLAVYAIDPERGLVDSEARAGAGISPTSNYWKRCSELRAAGFIQFTGEVREGDAHQGRIVCKITPSGIAAHERALAGGFTSATIPAPLIKGPKGTGFEEMQKVLTDLVDAAADFKSHTKIYIPNLHGVGVPCRICRALELLDRVSATTL